MRNNRQRDLESIEEVKDYVVKDLLDKISYMQQALEEIAFMKPVTTFHPNAELSQFGHGYNDCLKEVKRILELIPKTK